MCDYHLTAHGMSLDKWNALPQEARDEITLSSVYAAGEALADECRKWSATPPMELFEKLEEVRSVLTRTDGVIQSLLICLDYARNRPWTLASLIEPPRPPKKR